MALVAHLGDLDDAQVPYRGLVGGADGPGVHQARMDHHHADDRAQVDIASEHAGRRDGHQYRQQRFRDLFDICRNSVQEHPAEPQRFGNVRDLRDRVDSAFRLIDQAQDQDGQDGTDGTERDQPH